METDTLKNILYNEVLNTTGWITKGQLALVAEQHGYSIENGGRRLRELAEEEKILVDYYKGQKGQKLARYAKIGEAKLIAKKVVEIKIDEYGTPYAVYA